MAEEMNESVLELEEVEETKVIRLQAYIRGVLTRKWLKQLRQEFEELCQVIEAKPLELEWPSDYLCSAKIKNRKQRKTKNTEKGSLSKPFPKDSSLSEKLSVEIQTDIELTQSLQQQPNADFEDCGVKENVEIQVNKKEDLVKTIPIDSTLDYKDIDKIPEKDSSSVASLSCNLKTVKVADSVESSQKEAPGNEEVNISVNGDSTSVWDPDISSIQTSTEVKHLPTNKDDLLDLRKNLAMELLWIQQAIQSRKNYLKLKNQMV